jgi:hypothetical protein
MDSGGKRIVVRFPEHASSIKSRFHEDPSFREMCRDCADALEALQRRQALEGPQQAARIKYYQELANASEIEMVTALRLSSLTLQPSRLP